MSGRLREKATRQTPIESSKLKRRNFPNPGKVFDCARITVPASQYTDGMPDSVGSYLCDESSVLILKHRSTATSRTFSRHRLDHALPRRGKGSLEA